MFQSPPSHSQLELPQQVPGPGAVAGSADNTSPHTVSPADTQPPLPQFTHDLAPVIATSKVRKVSRACDFCKSRKSRCSGTHPCTQCVARGKTCCFNAKYTRGRPRTPPPAKAPSPSSSQAASAIPILSQLQTQSPPLSSVWSTLSKPKHELAGLAGDRPLPELDHVKLDELRLDNHLENRTLLALYFDVCIATYRVLHRPSTEHWLDIIERNFEAKQPIWQDLGHGRAAIVLAALAIATLHSEKSKERNKSAEDGNDEARALNRSDQLFGASSWLSSAEVTDCPTLEMAQAGILQVLYLLQTSRFNRAWYVFGNCVPVIWMIGLHRRDSSKRIQTSKLDYIQKQCRQRTFWTAYTLDNYLRIIFGRPRHFHDEDIDQQFPDRINDDDMTANLPEDFLHPRPESDIDGLIFHAKIAQIIGCISRQVYAISKISDEDRAVAAYRLTLRIKEWRDSLPHHLGSVSPSILVPRFRRQAVILQLAYHHAIMHASRPFLHGSSIEPAASMHVEECLAAAHGALEIANGMACEGPMFNAFWWTHYVVYCALVVVYMFEIRRKRHGPPAWETTTLDLEQAERCRVHLSRATATNSPSRRYGVILEELRAAATSDHTRDFGGSSSHLELGHLAGAEEEVATGDDAAMDEALPPTLVEAASQSVWTDPRLWDSWETTDWLELDSSAFRYPTNVDEFILWP